MSKGLTRSLSRGKAAERDFIVLRTYLTDKAVTVDGATGVGFGSVAINGLPEGHLLFVGARADLTLTESSASVTDTFQGDIGIGTTPADDATISGADVDIIASTAIPAATAGVATVSANNVTPAVLDNSDASGEINLNILIDDANISADGVEVTVTGYVTLVCAVLGED